MKKKSFVQNLLFPFARPLNSVSSGMQAPDFQTINQDGKKVSLSDFRGKFILMYFYPYDDTPGCTKEACEFRDNYEEIKKLNGVVFGVSRQGGESHKKFQRKHRLPFDLLVDADGKIAEACGIGKMPIIGLHLRQSILIGPDGKVIRFYESVNPKTHVDEVLKDIQAASSKG